METQCISLNMTPTGVNPCFHISQYDVGRMLGFIVHSGGATVDLDTYTCTIEATRSDGTAITSAVATTDNIGTFEVTPTMSNKTDKYRCQLVIVDANSKRIASLPFDMDVCKAAMDENSESIEEDASLYQQYTKAVQGAIAEANADIQAEENARIAAVNAEATARQTADNTLQGNINSEATARQSADNTLQGNINSEAATRASADSNLQSQINQIVAPSGEAPSAAEVQNARIGANGVTYDTLGTAIRTQMTNVNDNLTINYDLCSKGSDKLLSTDYMIYKGTLDADTGRLNQSDDYYATPFIRIKKNDKIFYDLKSFNTRVALIALYDNSMNYQNAIATGQSSGVATGYYTATADGYIRVCEYPSAFSTTRFVLGRYIAPPGEIETFNTAEIKDLREYLKYKGIIDSNGLSRYDIYSDKNSSYYYTPYILCSKNSILEYYLTTFYNTGIAGISIYDQNKNLLTAICGDSSGIEQGSLKVNAGNYVRMCFNPQSTAVVKAYIYAEDCANDKSFNERFFEKSYIKKSNGVQIYDNNSDYSVTPFIHVNLGDIVNYRLYSYNSDISLITLYDSNLSFVKSIAYGSPSNPTSGNYTFNSDGYIKVCSYGYTYSERAQFAQTNSSALMPCDIDKKNPTVLPTLTQANSRTRTISSEYWNHADIFTLLHFSDIHADYANIDRIVKYNNYLGGRVADAVCTGDMVRLKYSDGFDWWSKFGAQAVLTCIGNHDCTEGSGSYMQSDHTQAELYAQYIEPFLTYWKEPDTSVSSQENKSYYYKDYTYYKIRLIAINDYLTGSEATEQNAWLQTALADAIINGYSVIILTHQFGKNLTKLQCTFTSQSNIGEDSNIEAYKSSVQSFIENGGDFVCWLCGHTHRDYILKSTVYPTQLFLCVTTAQANEIQSSEAIRPYGDKAQDAFNLVSIDRTSKIIKIVRVGQDKDWMLRRLETLVIDYEHATVISNN